MDIVERLRNPPSYCAGACYHEELQEAADAIEHWRREAEMWHQAYLQLGVNRREKIKNSSCAPKNFGLVLLYRNQPKERHADGHGECQSDGPINPVHESGDSGTDEHGRTMART